MHQLKSSFIKTRSLAGFASVFISILSLLISHPSARAASGRADNFEEALVQAKASGRDIVVFQRGSDWNRLGEMLYSNVWMKDEFPANLGDGFVLVAVDRQEAGSAADTPASRLTKMVDENTALPSNEVTAVESKEEIPFAARPDGAFLGKMKPNPDKDTLTLKLKTPGGGRVLRLDFPADPSLPGGSAGRGAKGNFAISEIIVRDSTKTLAINAAWASASEGNSGAFQAIDGISDKPENAWNPAIRRKQSRTLFLSLTEPLPAGAEISIQLICHSQWKYHIPGCVRAAVLADASVDADVRAGAETQRTAARNTAFSWWDTTLCPRIALLDSQGRAVASENKPRLGLTPVTLANLVKQLRAKRETRDALWAKAEKVRGPARAELLRQSLDVLDFANWEGNDKCYKFIHDKIREADPKDESGAVRWLTFGGDPRDDFKWTDPGWSKILEKKDLKDTDYEEALTSIDKELKDPRNKALNHERLQRIMIAKYRVYCRWPKHEEKRFDVQRDIAAFDPDTFWGIGARGDLGLHHLTETPMLTYGWSTNQVKPGLNLWTMTDTAYLLDHAGPYKIRLAAKGGKDTLKILRIALLDGATVLSEARPEAVLSPSNTTVEAELNFNAWRSDLKTVLRVEAEATGEHTDIAGDFIVEPQLLPAPARDNPPEATDITSRLLERGEIQALQKQLDDTLLAEAAKGTSAVGRVAADSGMQSVLAQATLIRLCGVEKMEKIVKLEGGATFLQSFFKDSNWLDSFLASDKADWPQALENLYVLRRHGTGWELPFNQRLATALALSWGKGNPYRLVDRFHHVQRALQEGLMHVSFERLNVRELRWAVPTYGTARDFQFLLDDRQTRQKDYLSAHSGVRYVSFNVYGVTVQDQGNYVAPWAHVYGTGMGHRPFPVHKQVGGVCGTVSGYASAEAQAHGIPSSWIGQPSHCAFIIRVGKEWPVGNGVTWPSFITAPGWDGTGYSTMTRLYEPVNQDRDPFMTATRLGWLAQLQIEHARIPKPAGGQGELPLTATSWIATCEQAILAQPTNYVTWLEYIKTLETIKGVPATTWLDLGQRATRTFAPFNEAGWALARRCLDKVLPDMKPAERMALLLKYHQDLREENWYKPVTYPFDDLLNCQLDRIGDPALDVEFFSKLLEIHRSEKADCNFIFGNVMSWGTKRFAGNTNNAPAYAKAMETLFNSKGADALNKNLLATTLQSSIKKACETLDIVGFRLWSDMAEKMLPPLKPEDVHLTAKQAADFPKFPPFPGHLLSADGTLRLSSANPDDCPLSYRSLLSSNRFGGWLNTGCDKKTYAQVQLLGEGELSGIILVNQYEDLPPHREFKTAPLKVSVSTDGSAWTEVGSFNKSEPVYRIDLRGRNLPTRYIRAERIPEAGDSKPCDRFTLRGFLVYGKKLY